MSGLNAPRKLQRTDSRQDFDSGAIELDEWLKKYAWQNQRDNNATTYVITDGDRVVAYYAIAMAAVAKIDAPLKIAKGRPAQIPCILLARLAVDKEYGGQGLGWELLRDALIRTVYLSESIGAAAVLIHCLDTTARSFYLHHGDFLSSSIDPCHLMVSIKELKKLVTR